MDYQSIISTALTVLLVIHIAVEIVHYYTGFVDTRRIKQLLEDHEENEKKCQANTKRIKQLIENHGKNEEKHKKMQQIHQDIIKLLNDKIK